MSSRMGAAGLSRLIAAVPAPRTGAGPAPLAASLAARLRLLVLDGRVPLDCRLPSERELAVALAMSRTTVSAAYARLREQGFLASRQGSGSFTTAPGAGSAVRPAGPMLHPAAPGELGGDTVDLACAALPAGPEVHAAYAAALAALPRHLPGTGYDLVGLPQLREAVAEQYRERGVPTVADEVMVTGGTQHAIALVVGALVGAGDRVLVEHPTYPNALETVRRAGGRPLPVPVGDGDALAATLRQSSPVAGYVVPDFHNPTGACAGLAEREALVAQAAASRTVLVVDESLAGLWLDAPPPPPLAALAAPGAVVSVGGLSKTHWGGLRVGWIRADRALLRRLAAARAASDQGNPVLEQLAALELLRAPDAAETQRRRRAGVAAARADVEAALTRHVPHWRWQRPAGGLSLWAEMPAPASSAMAALAPAYGLRLAGGPLFGLDGAFERYLRVPLIVSGARADEVARRLAAVEAAAEGVSPPATRGWEALPVA